MAVKVKKSVAKKPAVKVMKAVAAVKAVKAVKKAVAKKAVAKKTAGKPAMMKGDRLECRECGLIITVDETCGCVGVHELFCCDEVMIPKKSKARR